MHYSFSHGQPFKCFLKACAGVMQPDITSSALCKCLAVTLCCSVFNHYLCLRLRGIRGGFFFLGFDENRNIWKYSKNKISAVFPFYPADAHKLHNSHTHSYKHFFLHLSVLDVKTPHIHILMSALGATRGSVSRLRLLWHADWRSRGSNHHPSIPHYFLSHSHLLADQPACGETGKASELAATELSK